jgi:thiol-disulfide isomerase/thioredoxin
MHKNVLLSSLLFTSLLSIGCSNNSSPSITDKSTTTELIKEVPTVTTESNQELVTDTSPPKSAVVGTTHQLPTVQGETITIIERGTGFNFPQYEGKIVLLQVFGKKCHFCFDEMPIVNKIKDKYSSNLQVIAIQAEDRMSKAEASELIATHNMQYPIIDKHNAVDLLIFLRDKYEWAGSLPFLLIIKDGVTERAFKEGKASYEDLEEIIKEIQ